MSGNSTKRAAAGLPVKWALVVVVVLILYALVQPLANSRFGWQLPTLATLLGEEEPKPNPKKSTASHTSESTQTATQESSSKESSSKESSKKATNRRSIDHEDRGIQSDLRYGILQEVGSDRYLSPSGLQYGPGSEEGHRLKHLERHLEDMPNRPGKHGVFEGDMAQVLKWIDEAYSRGMQGAKGVRALQEEGRTVYEVPFSQPIGYVGGRDGARLRHPPARQMRLVVQGKNFITAFPF